MGKTGAALLGFMLGGVVFFLLTYLALRPFISFGPARALMSEKADGLWQAPSRSMWYD